MLNRQNTQRRPAKQRFQTPMAQTEAEAAAAAASNADEQQQQQEQQLLTAQQPIFDGTVTLPTGTVQPPAGETTPRPGVRRPPPEEGTYTEEIVVHRTRFLIPEENPAELISSDESDGEQAISRSGCEIIIYKLQKHFAPNDVSQIMEVHNDLNSFRRRPQEALEEAFARWDIITERARRNQISIGDPQSISFKWFSQLNLPEAQATQLLAYFDNNLPRTPEGLVTFRQKIINVSRVTDRRSPYSIWGGDQRYPPPAATRFANSISQAFMTQTPSWDFPWNAPAQET